METDATIYTSLAYTPTKKFSKDKTSFDYTQHLAQFRLGFDMIKILFLLLLVSCLPPKAKNTDVIFDRMSSQ